MKLITLAGGVQIGLSDRSDGDMRTIGKTGSDMQNVVSNRINFLQKQKLELDSSALVYVNYDRDSFTDFGWLDKGWAGRGMIAGKDSETYDAVATRERELGLFLPLADCLGAVIYDVANHILCVAHLGRHSTEQFGAKKVIEWLENSRNIDPKNLYIWISPSAGSDNYPMFRFNNRSLRDVNIEQFISAGVMERNISGDPVDTTKDPNFFSHSQGDRNERFAIVAKML